ncbi:MAG: hypothetical protein QOE33_1612 [Acidobacteriota bacterium]|nr:hypothetical protein [Acidobacteriota bacterium]
MKAVKFGGRRRARRFVVRILFVALACALALSGGAARFGASAQKSAQVGTKQAGASSKVAPLTTSRGKFKAGGVKVAAAPGGEVQPLVLGCANTTTSISFSATPIPGTLASGDCVNPIDGSFYDAYSFTGTAGQQIVIDMTSTAFDTYLYLLVPGETSITSSTVQDDDGGTGGVGGQNTNSRILNFTLPTSGTYTILANSFASGATGAYTLTLNAGSVCSSTPVILNPVPGTPLNKTGSLGSPDCTLDDGSFYDVYTFDGTAGQQVAIQMTASFDTYLFLVGPDGDEIARDDNGTGGSNARIPAIVANLGASPSARLPQTGTYRIIANAATANGNGSYTLVLGVDAASCPSTPISVGQTINGTLASSDCRLPADSSFIDVYTFSGTAGQTISVSMTQTSSVDPYLFILDKDGKVLDEDDNGGGVANAHLPSGKRTFTGVLPATGLYTIYANSASAGQQGTYTLALTGSQACTYALTSASRTVTSAGGIFSDAYTTQAGCAAPTLTSNTTTFVTAGTVSGPDASGNGTFSYTVAANTTTSARAGTLTVGSQTFTINQSAAGSTACATTIFPNVIPFTQGSGAGRFTVFPVSAQCNTWVASTATSWIHITSPTGGSGTGTSRVRFNVDANTGTTTRVGTIAVGTSTLTVTQTSSATTPQVQFSNATYSVNENDASKSIQITVQRLGDTTGAASVEYRTVDDPAAVPCSTANGTAYARCDYVTTIDTIRFNAGETTKAFTIPLIDDVHVEGNETFHVALANPQGANLGAPTDATVTIVDNDIVQATTNPNHNQNVASGQTAFFVRMQYLDFLSREPEAGEPWTAVYAPCPNQDNTDPASASANCDRIRVSSNFFLSQEFQLKGFFVFLYYKVSFGAQSNPNYFPAYDEIIPDMRRVTGTTTEERIDKTFNFAEDWVTRPAFVTRYGSLSNAQFVDTLLSNVGATLTTTDPVSGQTRNSLVAALDGGTKTRAEVLRIIVESQEVNRIQFNPTFVAMQYYGYLRRTPEINGYIGWLNTINPPTSANPRDMVNGFVNSAEYYLRFGPNVRQ